MTTATRRPRGRPRSEACHDAILQATGELLDEGGLAAASMEAIAARAGVSKATIYKWWPSRAAVTLDGFLAHVSHTMVIREDVPLEDALVEQIESLIRLFRETSAGPLFRALVAAAESDKLVAQAIRERWMTPRRAVTREILAKAVARGEFPAGHDLEIVLDQIYGPLYFRLLIGHAPLEDSLPRTLVGNVLHGVAAALTASDTETSRS